MNDRTHSTHRGDPLKLRITPDGRVCFAALPADMLRVAAALCPDDADVRRRFELLKPADRDGAKNDEECRHGHVKADE
jgi:hypothetical protein